MTKESQNPLKVIVQTVQDYTLLLFRNWWLLLVFALVFLLIGFWRFQKKKVNHYAGAATFMLEQSGGGSGSTISGVLGSLGFSSGGGEELSEEKLLDLLRTRRIMGRALMTKAKVEGKEDYLINHFIEAENLVDEMWEGNPDMASFKFSHAKLDSFTDFENKIFKSLISRAVKNHLSTSVTKTRIMLLKSYSNSEDFICAFLPAVVSALESFYVSKSVEGQKTAFDQLRKRNDSIERALNGAEYSLAKWQDEHRGMIQRKGNTTESRLLRKITVLQGMFEESVKNVEIAKMNLLSETPMVQMIDKPLKPLAKQRTKLIPFVLPFVFIGVFLAIVFLALRKFLRDELRK